MSWNIQDELDLGGSTQTALPIEKLDGFAGFGATIGGRDLGAVLREEASELR